MVACRSTSTGTCAFWQMRDEAQDREYGGRIFPADDLVQLAPPSDSTSQWGHNIKIVGLPWKEFGSKVKSFLADMFGFASNSDLTNVTNYLRSHGGFELEQVSTKGDCVR